jgi:hypothetical protein
MKSKLLRNKKDYIPHILYDSTLLREIIKQNESLNKDICFTYYVKQDELEKKGVIAYTGTKKKAHRMGI